MTITEQLCNIYYKEETWHTFKMPYDEALNYHKKRLDNGSIYAYQENGEVFGYYERVIEGGICYLDNIYIKKDCRQGKVFKELYKHFFSTLPKEIDFIAGDKQKIGGKLQMVRINRRKYGKN